MKKYCTSLFLIVSIFASSTANSKETPRYQDDKATFAMRDTFAYLNKSLGFLTATTYLEADHKQEVKKFQERYDRLKAKYQSPAMDQALSLGEKNIADGQKDASFFDQQLKLEFNGDYTDGYAFLHAYQCTYSRRKKKGGSSEHKSEYVTKVNESMRTVRQNLFKLETQLPQKPSSGALMLTSEKLKEIDGSEILCKKFENGKLVEQLLEPVIEKVEKTRVPPFSASQNPQHEMMCRNLSDPRIPPPPPIKCVFNYK
jgi:hypothetical protein